MDKSAQTVTLIIIWSEIYSKPLGLTETYSVFTKLQVKNDSEMTVLMHQNWLWLLNIWFYKL